MKKKLAFMGVILQKNKYLILDEPFNGVDIHSNMIIVEILKKLRELGKTIIISSHIFPTLNEVCDEIYHLQNGILKEPYLKEQFSSLEDEMKAYTVGNKVKKLNL